MKSKRRWKHSSDKKQVEEKKKGYSAENCLDSKTRFLQTVTAQIRCTMARDGVAQEIRDHIEDQTEALILQGMPTEEAQEEAVRRMGDPVAIGTELDLIHRPQTNWRMVLLIVICTLGGLLIQILTGSHGKICGVMDLRNGKILALIGYPQMVSESAAAMDGMTAFLDGTVLGNQLLMIGLGFAVMLTICWLDYGFLGRWATEIYLSMTALAIGAALFLSPTVNGMHRGMILPMYLFIPVYAGILYQYRGERFGGILRAILWILLPAGISWRMIPSIVTAFNLCMICGIMILAAIARGWFAVDRRKTVWLLLGTGILLPTVMGVCSFFFLMADYQKHRIMAFLNPTADVNGAGYVTNQIRILMSADGLGIFSGIADQNADFLTHFLPGESTYSLLHLVLSYGLIFGIAVVIALIKLVLMAFQTSFRQKNQLGFLISFGCGLIFLVMCAEGIAVNFALLPHTTTAIPFLTSGGTASVVYSVLLGLLLAVNRYTDVLSAPKITGKTDWRRIQSPKEKLLRKT